MNVYIYIYIYKLIYHHPSIIPPGAKLGFLTVPGGPARTPRALRTLALLFRQAERGRRGEGGPVGNEESGPLPQVENTWFFGVFFLKK